MGISAYSTTGNVIACLLLAVIPVTLVGNTMVIMVIIRLKRYTKLLGSSGTLLVLGS